MAKTHVKILYFPEKRPYFPPFFLNPSLTRETHKTGKHTNQAYRENRVKFQHLKKETFLNSLSDADINQLWLPLIVFDNTDQKESTRLGMDWQWVTRVTVDREGDFTQSGIEEVDEAEIFEGAENSLTMNQTYTWEFQCQYELQRYPFDAQVTGERKKIICLFSTTGV